VGSRDFSSTPYRGELFVYWAIFDSDCETGFFVS
jgi:hypothetical protein